MKLYLISFIGLSKYADSNFGSISVSLESGTLKRLGSSGTPHWLIPQGTRVMGGSLLWNVIGGEKVQNESGELIGSG